MQRLGNQRVAVAHLLRVDGRRKMSSISLRGFCSKRALETPNDAPIAECHTQNKSVQSEPLSVSQRAPGAAGIFFFIRVFVRVFVRQKKQR